MWGCVIWRTSRCAILAGPMKAANDAVEFLHHRVEWCSQSRAAPDQDVIMPGAK
jgi:hypothetical protein